MNCVKQTKDFLVVAATVGRLYAVYLELLREFFNVADYYLDFILERESHTRGESELL